MEQPDLETPSHVNHLAWYWLLEYVADIIEDVKERLGLLDWREE